MLTPSMLNSSKALRQEPTSGMFRFAQSVTKCRHDAQWSGTILHLIQMLGSSKITQESGTIRYPPVRRKPRYWRIMMIDVSRPRQAVSFHTSICFTWRDKPFVAV